ncbi:MAG: murein transglycosylase A [Pseudomonadota bacterium]
MRLPIPRQAATDGKAALLVLLFLAACAAPPSPPIQPLPSAPTPTTAPPEAPAIAPPVSVTPFAVSKWEMLPDWQQVDLQQSWAAFLQSCHALKNKPDWREVCAHSATLAQPGNDVLRGFFEEHFTPYQVFNPDGSEQGLVTGYYEPRLRGSRVPTSRFRYPLYAQPDDLLTIDLSALYPQLKDLRLRGRVEGKRVVPYFDRSEIDQGKGALQGRELFWVDDAIDLFFLQIQGSGRIELPDGSLVKVGYADQNGHPYVSIGKKLIEMGELQSGQVSMQSIKKWAQQHPEKLNALLDKNPSYVFFRELPDTLSAPLGALGVPLTPEYSIAVDARTTPLGAPTFLATTYPNSNAPLNRLMMAQDTGGAIRGAVRADFFWGFGEQAGAQAGKMKQSGQMWVLLPRGMTPPATP